MPRAGRPILLAALAPIVVGAGLSLALAQDNTQWQPVDQTVSDLDLRATSSRRVEQGIGVYGQTGSLYRSLDTAPGWFVDGQPRTQQYQLREPGVTAWIDRPDYLVQDPLGAIRLNVAPSQDGRFIDLVPPNTVFDLVPTASRAFVPYRDPYGDGLGNTRVNTRFEGRIDTTESGQSAPVRLPMPRAHRLPPNLQAQRASSTQTQADNPATNDTPAAQTQPASAQDDPAQDTSEPDPAQDP